MGIKLLADTAPKAMKDQKFESCFGRKIAVSASMSIYQFLPFVTLAKKPVYVFDGHPPELKKQELAKRYSKREDATEDLNAAIDVGDTEGIEKYSKRTVKAIENIIAAKNKSSQGQLESFFKPVVNASAPPKRKEIEEEAKGTSTHNKSKAGGAKKK